MILDDLELQLSAIARNLLRHMCADTRAYTKTSDTVHINEVTACPIDRDPLWENWLN